MPKKTQEEAVPAASPELVFRPPPRRSYDNFDDVEGSEPRRGAEAPQRQSSKKSTAPPRSLVPKRSPPPKAEGGRSPALGKEVKVKKKTSGLTQKHSHEDMKALANPEDQDFAAPFRYNRGGEATQVRRAATKSKKSMPMQAPSSQRPTKAMPARESKHSNIGMSAPSDRSASEGSISSGQSRRSEEQQEWAMVEEQSDGIEALSPLNADSPLQLPSPLSSPARPLEDFDALPVGGIKDSPHLEATLLKALNGPTGPSPEALHAFHAALEEGTQPIQSVKLCFVGHARAGKTSTLKALAGRPFDPEQPSTHGVETCTFAKELMSAAPSRTTSSGNNEDLSPSQPWLEMEGEGSVAKLLEEKVAMAVADNMKATAQLDRGRRPSCAPTRRLLRTPSEEPPESREPGLVKMPVDLIARAISSSSRADSEPQRDVIMQTWDFAGQQMYYNMAHVFLTSFGIYALVLDISSWGEGRDPAFGEALESMDFWLAALLVHAPDAWLVIVGSHADALEDVQREEVYERINEVLVERLQQAHQHAKVLGNQLDGLLFFPVDNRRNTAESVRSIARLREALNCLALDVAKELQQIPTRWAHFFHILESQINAPCIEISQCRAQAALMGINSADLEQFLGLFHKLGQLLYFKGSPAVVLSPQWLLDAMAQVVACPCALARCPLQAQALRKRGDLSDKLLQVLWQDERFQGHEKVLQAFLEHFDLLVPGTDKAAWLVPSLLQRRPDPPAVTRPEPEVVFVLDFKGAFKRLLPTLIPRLLCQLRKRHGSDLQVFHVYADFAQLQLALPPVLVTFDMYPAEAPKLLRVEVTSDDLSGMINLEEFLDSLHAALEAWLPHVAYDTKLPCPCCAASGDLEGGHLLDLSDVLSNVGTVGPFCRHSARRVPASELPKAIRAWRERPAGATRATATAERPFMYMYSSPLYTRLRHFKQFPQLNVYKEYEALQGLLAGCTTQVATYATVESALQMRPAPSVLHVSCHSVPFLHGSVMRHHLLLEDAKGEGHFLEAEALRKMGGWENLGLLVLLACNSIAIAEELPCRSVCCRGGVSDSAVRNFCGSFYLHLFAGQTVTEAFLRGQSALKHHADLGLRAEAERFVLRSPRSAVEKAEPTFTRPRISDSGDCSPWPTTPPVERYRVQALDLGKLAATFVSETRVVMLTGPAGAGKTTFCRFFCRYFGAPGRLFAEGVALLGAKEMELLFETEGSLKHLLAKTVLDALNVQAWDECAWSALTSLTKGRRWLLILDGIDRFQKDNSMERLRKLRMPLEELLRTCTKLCVVLTSQHQREGPELSELDGYKVVPHPLSRLSVEDSIQLFLDRIVRKLYGRDFDLADTSPAPLIGGSDLNQRLRLSPLMKVLDGVPGAIVDAAAWVDCTLHSLLQHPRLNSSKCRPRSLSY